MSFYYRIFKSVICFGLFVLPGQLATLHDFCSERDPGQVDPPLVGVGFEQDRCRIAWPFQQVTEQLDQNDHSIQPPFTEYPFKGKQCSLILVYNVEYSLRIVIIERRHHSIKKNIFAGCSWVISKKISFADTDDSHCYLRYIILKEIC